MKISESVVTTSVERNYKRYQTNLLDLTQSSNSQQHKGEQSFNDWLSISEQSKALFDQYNEQPEETADFIDAGETLPETMVSQQEMVNTDSSSEDRPVKITMRSGAVYDYTVNASARSYVNGAIVNATHATIQGTGVFLKEYGGYGTLQHVNVVV